MPSFYKLKHAGEWAANLSMQQLAPLWDHSGVVDEHALPLVGAPVAKAVVEWIMSKAFNALSVRRKSTWLAEFHTACDDDKCKIIHKNKCSGNKMWWHDRYITVMIGKGVDEDGDEVEVVERLHRLVTWAKQGPPNVNMNHTVAMHLGRNGGANKCKSDKCVNPRHLQWGSQRANAQDRWDRSRKGKGAG